MDAGCENVARKFYVPLNNSFIFHVPVRKGDSLRLYDGAGDGSCMVRQLLSHSTGCRRTVSRLVFGLRGRRCCARLLRRQTGRISGGRTRNVYKCVCESSRHIYTELFDMQFMYIQYNITIHVLYSHEHWTFDVLRCVKSRYSLNPVFKSIVYEIAALV